MAYDNLKEYIIQQFVVEGKTQKEIAEVLGKSEHSISYLIRKYGIQRNSKNKRLKYSYDEQYFSKWSANMAYSLGFLICDGYVIDTGRVRWIGVDIQERDRSILEFIRDQLDSRIPITERVRIDKRTNIGPSKQVSLKFGSKAIIEDIATMGVFKNKTGKEFVVEVPKEFIPDYLRGIVDGDGNIYVGKTKSGGSQFSINIYSASESFLTDLKEKYMFGYGTIVKKKTIYVLRIFRKNEVVEILKYIYNGNFCLERKYKKYLEINELYEK
jgi:hypothetical protein